MENINGKTTMLLALAAVSQTRSLESAAASDKIKNAQTGEELISRLLELVETMRLSQVAFLDWSSATMQFKDGYIKELEEQCLRFSTLIQGKANGSNSN